MPDVLGLTIDQAKEILDGRKVEVNMTLPPRHPEKSGTLRVVRVRDTGETVELSVSPFNDVPKGEENG